jgi:peptidoglycan/xylan/chitin deacetylase (PgdA/CDA1 family)
VTSKYKAFSIIILLIILPIFSCTKNDYQQNIIEKHKQKENVFFKNIAPSANNGSGIILSFDDYFPDSWKENFDLFAKYNANVTFFVQLESPTPFCFAAQTWGHEIGYHTISHPSLPTLTKERFFEETISRIDLFRNKGIELTSFAYPFGFYEEWMHNELLKYYQIVRGFGVSTFTYNISDMKYGFVYSKSIDNIIYKSEKCFQEDITKILEFARENQNTVVLLTSHNIGTDDWGITVERLEFILKKGNELNLVFYTYKDLQ